MAKYQRGSGPILNRREFIAASAAGLGVAGMGCFEPTYEGIYTDRFTYRHGEEIVIHAALLDASSVDVKIVRKDGLLPRFSQTWAVPVTSQQDSLFGGIYGAGFGPVMILPASALAPGFYEVSIPPEAMREHNRTNSWNRTLRTDNWYAHFVVSGAEPGEISRILWIHDSLSSVAYGTYGGVSIYGDGIRGKQRPIVSWQRPSLTLMNVDRWTVVVKLQSLGYETEFIDLLQLEQEPPDFLDLYNLVLVIGKYEYVTHDFLDRLRRYHDGGGNVVVAGTEFALYRVRLETQGLPTLETYKSRAEVTDGLLGPDPVVREDPDSDQIAGVGMNAPGSYLETEVVGASLLASWKLDAATDFPIYHWDEVGWMFDGTGISEGGALPVPAPAFAFALGNLIEFDDANEPFALEDERTRTHPDTVVWSAVPVSAAKAWWLGDREPLSGLWPTFESHAVCTYRVSDGGGRLVQFPSDRVFRNLMHTPFYSQVLSNLLDELSG